MNTPRDAQPRQRFLMRSDGAGAQRLPYLLWLPPAPGPHTPLWVSVHGVTRQALSHAQAFHRPARSAGAALLVPLFSAEKQRRYQRLAHPVSGRRADLALLQTVQRVRRQQGLAAGPLYLFGYSAGAQFAHRFAMAHPQQVAALALGAAGWYTWPDDALPYPLGWAGMAQTLGLPSLERSTYLALPTAVWVGERDNEPDAALRSSPALDALQGPHRLERARRWAAAVDGARRLAGLTTAAAPEVQVHPVPRAGHDFVACARRGRLAWQVAEFFEHCRADRSAAPAKGATSDDNSMY